VIETNLTNGREVDGKYTAWWVSDGTRATSMRIVAATDVEVSALLALAPSAAEFTAANASLVGVHDHAPLTGNAETDSWAEDCHILGRCFGDHYVSPVAHPLFRAAAAANFADDVVFGLLAGLHAEATR
jgi:hypothetical protein